MTDNRNSMVQYEAFSSVVPLKPTFSRPSFRISTEKYTVPGILKRCFCVLLCYKKASSEDSGWIVAGWTKTSMGIALSEKPMLAGRLRRVEDGGLEIVSNDSGIRLVEAQIPMTLDEFVGLRNKEEVRKQLVFWKSIDDQNTQFSPLMYIQVTNFKCGAYAMGISCSILLADPISMSSFLKRWAKIHMNLFNESQTQKLPLLYLPNFGIPDSTPVYNPNYATPKETTEQTMIFKFTNLTMDNEMQRIVAVSCIDKANRRLGNKATSNFSLLVKDPSNATFKIETVCVKEVVSLKSFKNFDGINSKDSSWADFINADELLIAKENKPIDCRSWISSPVEEGLVMIISSNSNVTVIVTVATSDAMEIISA
ncbi:Anthranilate N-benzoyltransferase protein 3 [Heracleum sosnowskyi]|uniref:Anthranilate N-benzoyltransferase protein 3 n=1 Tax=Heracleum sosnowskyi TaxID=360622 RepID=A0AAD8HHT2_9APIA|nr:Anthranilate N-benzoyltransferase protein 3 [Heracleum sosnowskyi]